MNKVKIGKAAEPQRYFTYPLDPPPGGMYTYPGGPIIPAPVAYQQQAPIKQVFPMKEEVPQVTLMLSVPAVVPPGTSVTVTVQVANSNPQSGTVVSVSNPVVSAANGNKPSVTPNDAIVIDANADSGRIQSLKKI